MKIYPLLFILLIAGSAKAQLFNFTYDDCKPSKTCLYCGDTMALPTKNLSKEFKYHIEHAPYGYDIRTCNFIYEVYIDSTGQPCVVSVKNLGHDWQLMDDIRRWINNLPKWKPAMKDHQAINSTVILHFHFDANSWISVRFLKPDSPLLEKEKIKEKMK